MKKILSLVLALVMICTTLAMFASCGGSTTADIVLITDKGNIDDKSFNQGAWEGVVAYAEAKDLF